MSIFVSPQDYITMANDCEQVTINICDHIYKLWCKKDRIEDVNYILDKIKPIIEKINANNPMLSFEKVLFMTIIEVLNKDKDYKIENNSTNCENRNDTLYKNGDCDTKKDYLIDDFVKILEYIFLKLNEQE